MSPRTWPGRVNQSGVLTLYNRPAFARWLQDKHAGQAVIVTVKREPKRQGGQSMRYYRGVVVPDIAEAMGHSDPDDFESIHDALAWKFLRLPDGPLGSPRRRSTAKDDLTQDEMTDYINRVITFAEAEIVGCRVRRPNEVDDWDRIHDPGWA